MKIRNPKSKCASYARGIGICLCIVFMSIGVVGITAVGLSKNDDMGGGNMGMSSMGTMSGSSNNMTSSFQQVIISFFSGFWGEVILLISFVSMIAGMWFSNSSNNKKPIPIAIAGSIVLYISMYLYYSIALEIAGIVILAFAYVFIYSHRVAKVAKLI